MARTLLVMCLWLGACAHDEPSAAALAPSRELVVRTTLEVREVRAASEAIREIVAREGAHLERAREEGTRGASYEIRVAPHALAGLRTALGTLGEIVSGEETSADLSAVIADGDARLRAARAREQRLLELLADRTSALSDVLAVEAELARARESIETLEAAHRALHDRVSLARVALEVRARSGSFLDRPVERLHAAATLGVRGVATLGLGIAMLALLLGPSVALIGGLGALGSRVARRRRAR
ncbi:DUF4349 domain-containing protein [Sandaracinus amylolyticus]|uniref:DUF4349 domain-containing protein n=1 Tax=Sandaracinus amylolyticus TaxID=927083 RepID=UPI001F15B53C|nr:DUF4349 domain-containing protein [Sandaracinus amylolyticus]UJR85698.1 Hypothetical protein I5071_77780 [Sandaracinus amylolyticus]